MKLITSSDFLRAEIDPEDGRPVLIVSGMTVQELRDGTRSPQDEYEDAFRSANRASRKDLA